MGVPLGGVEVGGNYEGAAGYPIVDLAQNKTLLVDQKDVDDTEENDEQAHKVILGVCSPFFRMMRDLRHHPTSLTTFQVLLYLTMCLVTVIVYPCSFHMLSCWKLGINWAIGLSISAFYRKYVQRYF